MASGVLSFSGRCSSRARTIQLAMIVIRTMYSNGVHTSTVKEHLHCNMLAALEVPKLSFYITDELPCQTANEMHFVPAPSYGHYYGDYILSK